MNNIWRVVKLTQQWCDHVANNGSTPHINRCATVKKDVITMFVWVVIYDAW